MPALTARPAPINEMWASCAATPPISGVAFSVMMPVAASDTYHHSRSMIGSAAWYSFSASWSLRAILSFWLVAAIELIAIRLLAPVQPWIWMLLLSLPLASWFLDYEKWRMARQILASLDDVAAELSWTRLGRPRPEDAAAEANICSTGEHAF